MARGNNRQAIFGNDLEARSFLGLVEDVRHHHGWTIHAWCLMPNHVHLLLTTEFPNLSQGVRDILGRYARRYNHFHERTGHLFSARFKSVTVVSDRQFLTTFRYVNRNPVRAGLASAPDLYPWTGFALRRSPRPPVALDEASVLEMLHPLPAIAEQQLRHLVHDETAPGRAEAAVPSIPILIQALGMDHGVAAALALGYRQRAIAAAIGLSESALSRRLRRRRAS